MGELEFYEKMSKKFNRLTSVVIAILLTLLVIIFFNARASSGNSKSIKYLETANTELKGEVVLIKKDYVTNFKMNKLIKIYEAQYEILLKVSNGEGTETIKEVNEIIKKLKAEILFDFKNSARGEEIKE